MTIFVFVLVLMVVAGLVAAGGDRMGHRAARAKIRIGTLRPRTASTIIAVITGILISLVTFGVVFAVWADFRDALLRFDTIKGDLARMEEQYNQAEAKLTAAESAKKAAEDELAGLRQSKIEVVKNLAQAQTDLASAQGSLKQVRAQVTALTGQVKQLNAQIDNKKREVDIFAAMVKDRQSELTRAQAEVKTYQKGDVVLARDTPLAYQRVKPGDLGNLAQVLQPALDRATIRLSKYGLGVASDAGDAARRYVDSYPYKNATQDYVIVIGTASNVLAGEKAELNFDAAPLSVLVHKGDVVLDVLVQDNRARITSLKGDALEGDVPTTFNTQSLVDFSVKLQESFLAGASALGFLPDLKTGEIPSPVMSLTGVASDLTSRKRPFIIQFVAKEDADALSGLANAEIYISNPPTGQKPE